MPKNNTKNLIPNNQRSPKEVRENGRKGGIKSGEIRKQKSLAKDVMKMILAAKAPIESKEVIESLGLPETEFNMQTALLTKTMQEGLNGNIRATEFVFNLTGELEHESYIEPQNIYTGLPARILGKSFIDIYRSILDREYRFFDFKGGRGSLKSSFCGLAMIDDIMQNESHCAIAMRQVKDTLKDSVYAQLMWAIDELGISDEFKCTVSPMQIQRKSTGQIIYFRGGDDPMKIKSIKPPKGMYIGCVWFEEKDAFRGMEAIRSIQQSVMRGGDDIIVLSSYNTPISQQHFINKEALESNDKRIVHHSYYFDSPKKWLGEPFFDEAKRLKEINEKAYRHEYRGEAMGTGGTIFENVNIREITDMDISQFDYFYFGIDWGFAIDPTAFVKCSYDSKRRILYIVDEFKALKANNFKIKELLEEHKIGYNDDIICDTSDSKSIADLQDFGYRARGTEKGAGSIDRGIKWLQGLTNIVIDNKRCPNTATEFLEYEYERTKDNEIISRYPDKNNHFIDATRYAMITIIRTRGM